eukprot:CAMPEP_0206548164 /NCGR_PEP_ID=MMETSP0325_2-20121206/13726_1 /ASSEMBLY_ACC=CAM_ASM_000347 /TAXON_ID=2866 /ORGANISM="Crypthecodinium cohnii, Strain Seligo" /LENGTH=87 /DNA_ID=CAMNT_0054047603 /DNA_START=83 /DNA_END=342 /DNA_ORIENTATION=-
MHFVLVLLVEGLLFHLVCVVKAAACRNSSLVGSDQSHITGTPRALCEIDIGHQLSQRVADAEITLQRCPREVSQYSLLFFSAVLSNV